MKDSFSRREHIGWVDLLRVLACFLVVFAHCCDPFVGQLDADRGAFLTGAFAGSLVRCSVPLFVMMTGVLLLPVGEGMGAFYRRRIGRIVPPLLFWSLALPALYCVYLNCGGTTDRLAKFAGILTGRMRGGYAQTSVVLSTMMGGVSGSAIADAAMEARLLGGDMKKAGYSKGFIACNIAFTGLITATVPPGTP